jgi:hypothetical protein
MLSEEREAREEIGAATSERNDVAEREARRVGKKEKELDQAKIDATKAMADAERKIDDEKVEATEELTEAEKEAREGVEEAASQ